MVVFVDLSLTQKQGLSPAMQTSMHLLQMNNLQLRTYIADLMYRNPVVELECPEIDFKPNPFERGRSTRTNHLSDQQDEQDDYTAEQSAEQDPLHDLFLQSAALDLKQSDAEILRYLILSLDENGFLTESASESARILQVSEQQVQSNIVRLQSMEPAGIGAANLSNCLVLQLQRMTPVNPVAVQIAASFLDQLAKQQTGTIAKALGVTRAEVHEACELIRTLNPRPMNGLGTRSETPYILPDFYITEENGQLHVIMNDYYLPKIIIDPTYQQIIQSGALDKSDQEYIQKNYKEAAEIVNFISYRKSTMQKVMQYILHAQKAFFLSGPGYRTAMNNAEIAAALNLHESTISRAVTGKFFQCKWGVYPLRSLFTHRIHETDTDQVLLQLQELIAAEPEGAAYSDQQLAEILSQDGVQIARRTVVKYRQKLGIPTSRQRNAHKRT